MSFVCEQCGNTTFDQLTQKQVICLKCGHVNFYNSGYKPVTEFELTNTSPVIDLVKKSYVQATLLKRFVNYMIDTFVIVFLVMIARSFLNIESNMDMGTMNNPQNLTQEDMLLLTIMLIVSVLYYTLMEFFFGKTVGKFFTRTKVISADGSKAGFFQCIARSACRIIPFDNFSGLIMNGSFWHDLITKTKVVEEH